jgi:hypothetical protein
MRPMVLLFQRGACLAEDRVAPAAGRTVRQHGQAPAVVLASLETSRQGSRDDFMRGSSLAIGHHVLKRPASLTRRAYLPC